MRNLAIFLCIIPTLLYAGESIADALKLIETGNNDAARKMLEEIVAADGSNAEARYHLGKLLASQFRKYDDAEEQLEKAVELAGTNAEYHFTLGNLYGIQAQNASIFSKLSYAGKVKDQFLRAVELSPETIRYRLGLLGYYLQAPGIAGGSVSKAREQAAELLKRDAYEGHIASAQIAEYEKEYTLAEQEYKSAIGIKPDRWRTFNLLGYLYLKMNKPDDAIAQFILYVKYAPKDPNSYDSLADGYTAKGNVDAALANYLNALAINPVFPSSLYGTARCYDTLGKKLEARQYYQKFLDHNPKGNNADRARERVKELSE